MTKYMCSYTTTTHTRDHSYYPLFHLHHTPHTNRSTQSGQHFPLFLGTRDSRKRLPQLPERTDRPVHAANTQQCTRVTPPHHTTTRWVRPLTQHHPHMPAPMCVRRSPPTPCAHKSQQVRVCSAQMSMARSAQRDDASRRDVIWARRLVSPPLRPQHAPSASYHGRGLMQRGQ